jgi:hypothetical protein
MNVLLEQETNMSTIAALSTIAVLKTDNNHAASYISRQVQTDVVKGGFSDDLKRDPLNGSFQNMPPCDPVEIYFKDLSYSVQKMFSKSEYARFVSRNLSTRSPESGRLTVPVSQIDYARVGGDNNKSQN